MRPEKQSTQVYDQHELHILLLESIELAGKHFPTHMHACTIMAYGSTPYVGMTPKKNGGHIQSAQMTRSKCPR